MVFPEISDVKRAAAQRVRQMPNATRLVAVFVGLPALLSLVLTVLSYMLNQQIAGTGGLDGLGVRSFLETAQSMLQILSTGFSLFWGFGYVAVTLRWARGESAGGTELLTGFRCFGPVVRSTILKGVIYFAVVLLASQVSSFVFAMTPLSKNMTQLMEQMLKDPSFVPAEEQLLNATLAYLPFLAIALAAALIPVSYRLRMMDYVLMDEPKLGAFYALRMSLSMTRHNCIKLLRLDVSFWWFYLLELVTSLVYYGDLMVQLSGMDTGLSAEAMLFIACAAGLALQAGLYIWRRNRVATAYAMVYESLKPRLEDDPAAI